jgi:outer membrane receptor for ferric coprogen and ferric-rhodotorulic acid
MDISGIARGGLPSFYTDGSLIDWSRSDSNAADWTYSDRTTPHILQMLSTNLTNAGNSKVQPQEQLQHRTK